MNSEQSTIESSKQASPVKAQPRAAIYLDNHATTPVDPVVFDAMLPFLRENFGNPASTHSFGIKAKYAVEKARTQVATALHADESEILFTAGATESNNFIIKGVFEYFKDQNPHIIVSEIEHKCVLEAAKHVEKLGAEVTVLKVNADGQIKPAQLDAAIKPNTVLVSIMFANNEIGSINDVRKLAEVCHKKNILFHTDAAQAIGKVPIDVHELGIDYLSASGHKFYGPKGIGFVYVADAAKYALVPLLDGGGQEGNLRSGTLNVPGIVGIGKAIELATTEMDSSILHYLTLRNHLYGRLTAAFPDIILNGTEIISDESVQSSSNIIALASSLQRLPHNLNITLPSIEASSLARVYTVAFSSTSACSSGKVEPSYVLLAIGRTPDEAQASLRFGIGRFNTISEVDQAVDDLVAVLQK